MLGASCSANLEQSSQVDFPTNLILKSEEIILMNKAIDPLPEENSRLNLVKPSKHGKIAVCNAVTGHTTAKKETEYDTNNK